MTFSGGTGLSSLAQTVGRYKRLTKWVVYAGEQRQLLENGVTAIPYADALEELASA